MATHSSVLAWRIPGTGEPGRLHSPWGRKESNTTEHTQKITSQTDKKHYQSTCAFVPYRTVFRLITPSLDHCLLSSSCTQGYEKGEERVMMPAKERET